MGVLPAGRVAAELLSELLSTQHPVSTPRAHCMLNLPLERHVGRRVPELMQQEGLPAIGHGIGEHFAIGPVRVEVTPADHAWQNDSPGVSDRIFQLEDSWGFWIETPDGTIWAPGDSRLIPDHHLRMPAADAMLFDFSDSEWHFGLDGAIEMANAYPDTPLLLYHWGVWTPPTSHRSTPTPTRCRAGSRTRNASASWHPASPLSCTGRKLEIFDCSDGGDGARKPYVGKAVHERSDHRSVGVSHMQTRAAVGTEQRCHQAWPTRTGPAVRAEPG
jgi:hypothetical protein